MHGSSESGPVLEAVGSKSRVRVFIGARDLPNETPLITGSMQGGFEWWTDQAAVDLKDVFNWVNRRKDGAWIGTLPKLTELGAPAGFIQSNLSAFYRNHHKEGWSDRARIWRDFYFACFYELLSDMDEAFGCEVIRAQHPTLTSAQWSIYMQGTFLDALNHLVEHRELSLREIHLGCPHEMTPQSLRSAAEQINQEQASSNPPKLIPITSEVIDPSNVGCPRVDGLTLKRVEIRGARG